MGRRNGSAAGPLAGVIVLGLFAFTARADIVLELEGSQGPQVNGTYLSAQAIAAASFTPNTNPDVEVADPTATVLGYGGGNDVDYYSFAVAGPGEIHLDIDGAGFDTIVSLFDAGGTRIAVNDDGGVDPGSTPFDSLLRFVLPTAGTYFAAVSQWPNFANADGSYEFAPGPTGGTASYRLEISLANPASASPAAPLPGVAWAGLALLGGFGIVQRWRARRPVPATVTTR